MNRTIIIQVVLFIATFITTTLAGTEWVYGKSILVSGYTWDDFLLGLPYSLTLLGILSVHEFGHYFTAKANKINSSLPYYIPLPPLPFLFGTMGAVIRLRSKIYSLKQNFDVGLAGPLAGFILAFILLWYGFATLPPIDYVFQFHPEYEQYGSAFEDHVYQEPKPNVVDVVIGKNLLWMFFETFVADPERAPNPHEIMHYPVLFAGFLSLVFTVLNLMPFGQLDGGHIVYGLFGYRRHRIIASGLFILFMAYSGLGIIAPGMPLEDILLRFIFYGLFLYLAFTGLLLPLKDTIMITLLVIAAQLGFSWTFPGVQGYQGWLLFGFIAGRVIKIPHPKVELEEPLDLKRKALGWLMLIIFVISFSPRPILVTMTPGESTPEPSGNMVMIQPASSIK